MRTTPPRLAVTLLRWFCNIEYLEEIEGDLFEEYQQRRNREGKLKADLFYFRSVLGAIKPYPSTRSSLPKGNLPISDLLKHFFKITWRGMARSKATSFINITGLTFSIACFLLIAIYIIDEMTFESMHPNASNTYRISHSYKRWGDGVVETDVRAPGNWVAALKESIPQIKTSTKFSRFGYPGSVRTVNAEQVFVEQQFFWTDPTYTDIFHVDVLTGAPATATLTSPNQVIINEKIAQKYFGTSDPIGKELIYSRDGMDFLIVVASVMKDYPSNTHFHPDFIASYKTLEPLWKRNNEDRINSWRDSFTYSYVTLEAGTNPEILSTALRQIFDKHIGEDAKYITPVITPMTQIHFTTGYLVELESAGDSVTVIVFVTIGLLILIIACTNYMNLATARSMKRSKEVGLRKTFGVRRSSLVLQFFGESFFITAISIVLAIAILLLLLPAFNQLSGKQFVVANLLSGEIFQLIVLSTLAIGFLSGVYPALYLSGFNPLQALKGKLQRGKNAEAFRQALVVVQFAITLLLIVGTFVITGQLNFINESKLNTEKDQIITIRLFNQTQQQIQPLQSQLQQNALVKNVAIGTQLPRLDNYGWIDTRVKAPSVGDSEYIWQQLEGDFNFPELFNMTIIEGRNFNEHNVADSNAVLINETALKALNVSREDAIGLTLLNTYWKKEFKIIGVIKDFPYATIRKEILPLIVNGHYDQPEAMHVKFVSKNGTDAISLLQTQWKKLFPLIPFDYWFIDDEFGRMYKSEIQTASMIKYFAALAIIVACMGLFGLAAFTAEQKTKEIGIRKVLGASTFQVLSMLSTRFIKLIVIAMLIGTPITYFACALWLENFVYKIDLTPVVFIIAIGSIFVITILTVGMESIKAATANPVESIKDE